MQENNFTFTLKLKNHLKNVDAPDSKSSVTFYSLKPKEVTVTIAPPGINFETPLKGENSDRTVTITNAPQKIRFKVKHNKNYNQLRKLKFTETNGCKPEKKSYRRYVLWGPKHWKVWIEHNGKDINKLVVGAQTTVTATDKQY